MRADNDSSIDALCSGSMLIRGEEECIQLADCRVPKIDFNDGCRFGGGTGYSVVESLERSALGSLEGVKSSWTPWEQDVFNIYLRDAGHAACISRANHV